MIGPSRFVGKIAVVAGAEHPLAHALVLRLAGFGATVVAIGKSMEILLDLARQNPAHIEPLSLMPDRRDQMTFLRDAWGDQPIDVFVDLSALRPGMPSNLPDAMPFSETLSMASAMMAGIRAGKGRGVLAFPGSGAQPSPEEQAQNAGFEGLVAHLARDSNPANFYGLRVPVGLDWTKDLILSAGDAMLMLCHPVSRGVRPGIVIDWSPSGA